MAKSTTRNPFYALCIAAAMLTPAICAGGAPPPRGGQYTIDETSGKIAFYAGGGYRCFVTSKDTVASVEDLERRVGRLPQGTQIYWMPYRRESSGTPVLFSEGKYAHFAKFCREHKIKLMVDGEK